MSYASAVEPLRAANILSGETLYVWRHISVDSKPVAASNGAEIRVDQAIGATAGMHAVLVCAGGNPTLFRDRRMLQWLRRLARHRIRIGGVSGGPYLLARAGLLDGRSCTIHWEHFPAFVEEFPTCRRRARCSSSMATA
jgi:transcriptional regulator GlxA family with amidase domain